MLFLTLLGYNLCSIIKKKYMLEHNFFCDAQCGAHTCAFAQLYIVHICLIEHKMNNFYTWYSWLWWFGGGSMHGFDTFIHLWRTCMFNIFGENCTVLPHVLEVSYLVIICLEQWTCMSIVTVKCLCWTILYQINYI